MYIELWRSGTDSIMLVCPKISKEQKQKKLIQNKLMNNINLHFTQEKQLIVEIECKCIPGKGKVGPEDII